MQGLSFIEKRNFIDLFNRAGYVLDFSTVSFNIFTKQSVGIALCEKYGMSKGKSLEAYVAEVGDREVIKLFGDLLSHYEMHYDHEIADGDKYASLYKKCRGSIDSLSEERMLFTDAVEALKETFSSDYITAQIGLMIGMQKDSPTEAIGKAKELIESCCKTILEKKGILPEKQWDIIKLVNETVALLKVTPNNIDESIPEAKAIKAILGNLRSIASNIATLRNAYGSGHGKSASYKGLEERHAKLAVGSSITLVHFLWDSYEWQNPVQ